MRDHSVPGHEPLEDPDCSAFVDVVLRPSAEEVAFAAELAALDAADRDGSGLDEVAPWDTAVLTDDEVVAGLSRGVQGADLMVLESVDPRGLSADLVRVEYLRAVDRVAARVASLRHRVVVALVGPTSGQAYLPEVHAEHEIAVARRTSRYAAGRAIEVARALATTFPGFAGALRDGEVTDAHCAILVERTRAVTDDSVLAEIGRRVLPQAKRSTPGEFATQVTTAVARLDRDAAARVRTARASRRVWSRQLEDGMGYLGLTHDWSTIHAITAAVAADGRTLQAARPRTAPCRGTGTASRSP